MIKCEYCEDVPSRYKAIRAELFHQVKVDDIYNIELEVNFCPVCGRDLKGNKDKEENERCFRKKCC